MAQSRVEAILENILGGDNILPAPASRGEALLIRIAETIKNNVPKIQVANQASEMEDHTQIYIYLGSETGYTHGDWYYYDTETSTWKSGGPYQANTNVDDTLSISGMAADAAAVTAAVIAAQAAAVSEMKIYIEELTSPTEDDATANTNILPGMFFMINNRLYRSTRSIATGTTIQEGVNCTQMSLSDALNFLQT